MVPSIAHLAAAALLLAATSAAEQPVQTRWSRQISSYTADISDWTPLSSPVEREPPLPPIKRQAVAEPRILSEPYRPGFDSFPARNYYNSPSNRQLYLQSVPSVPSAPQNYLTEQGFGQSIRFGLQQPNFPLSQGFVAPQFGFENLQQNVPQNKRPQETFPKLPPVTQPLPTVKYNQVPILKPFNTQTKKVEAPKFVDGYRAENSSNDFFKKPQSLQKIKYESFDKPRVPQQNTPKVEREEVQLLYVPLEQLNRGQFNFRSPVTNTQVVNMDSIYNQAAQRPIKAPETQPIQKPINNFSGQNFFNNFNAPVSQPTKEIDQVPKFSTLSSPFPSLPPVTPVTSKPKKLKPHQPPLAIFLVDENGNSQVKVGDVLNSLKHASSVPVLDSVNPANAPRVFIGPSTLQALDKYVKFELPYLSNIENSDKKLRQLPFFVAPLSYNTPQGFAKIPFPSPHVGSVVINSQIKESKPAEVPQILQPNYYTGAYRQEQKPFAPPPVPTLKPTVNFYTASPNTNPPQNNPSNYYSFEPQTVSTLKPIPAPQNIPPIRPGSYYDSQYNFPTQNSYPVPEVPKTTTTQKAIIPTTKPPSTYPSQLLETHNPYSINQAFHFSTPLDYHTYYEDLKEQKPAATPVAPIPTQEPIKLTTTTPKLEYATQKTYQQQAPNYVQSYTPEIHYETEGQNRYTYNSDYNIRPETPQIYNPIKNDNTAKVSPPQYQETQETQAPITDTVTEEVKTPTEYEEQQQYEYNQYQTSNEEESTSTTSTTTTTTTRRPIRQRTRTRYTTTPRTDSNEYTTRSVTRTPFRERKPLPTKRYEPNKITTEKPTRKPIDYSNGETTTKSTRTRIRGRVTFRPNDSELSERRKPNEKTDQDLAYQRDVLHQNYPVTIQERMSTSNIEAMTEPSPKISTRLSDYATATYDTENAYTNEKLHSISPFNSGPSSDEDIPVNSAPTDVEQPDRETTYVPRVSNRNEEFQQTKSSAAPDFYETTPQKEEYFAKQTAALKEETVYATESITLSEESGPSYSVSSEKTREVTTAVEPEPTTIAHVDEEENIVQTTPSYNRVRVRPGVVKQYHQASSTESSRLNSDRRRPVTYRPAFDKRRTTMRIDEIEADLKTKEVSGRQEHEYRHPVYKPDPTTEATTLEFTTKRGPYRRRRPSYTTTTTEASERVTSKNKYEVKNKFRSRQRTTTTEKPTDKPEVQGEVTTTKNLHSRYSPRPRLSERYHKKTTQAPQEESADQEPNFSYNRPKYTEPETDIWSDSSFKPYNPNNILDDAKFATTERRSDRDELDIITARNEFEEMLISVTPSTNNKNAKKISDIPPTLEALVEQSKVTSNDANENMSNFETMLEEVMKSLEEQDENEYSSNVMKHKGGEIGEIPPERIIAAGDTKTTQMQEDDTTATLRPSNDASQSNEETPVQNKTKGRGFWKKVKIRPVTEAIDTAESQYYHSTVSRFGQPLRQSHEKSNYEKPRISVTTYKPYKDIFSSEDDAVNEEPMEVFKTTVDDKTTLETQTATYSSPGDIDFGTGSPESTVADEEDQDTKKFSFMDYFFGVTSEDEQGEQVSNKTDSKAATKALDVEFTTEAKLSTESPTETSYVPEEITESVPESEENLETVKVETEQPKVEETTQSEFMNVKAMSTAMSTEISHETEICYKGKCIKTSKDIL